MLDIASNIISLKKQIPSSVKVVAVTKTRSFPEIMEAYRTGHRIFGENRVQELLGKKDTLPADIEWHLIGHLQTNKVRLVVPFISMIHSVDSFRLLRSINLEASKIGQVVNCLLQIHIAEEETKFGFDLPGIYEMIRSEDFNTMKSVKICGLMGMATLTDDGEMVRKEFRYLADCFGELKGKYFDKEPAFRELSMGMSGDYHIAIGEGSTIIRIGSLIFGERN